MEDSSAAISPATSRAKEDNDLSKICNEMKTWLSGSPATNRLEDNDKESKRRPSTSSIVGSATAGSPMSDVPKSAQGANERCEEPVIDTNKPEDSPSLSNAPSKLSAVIQRINSDSAHDGCDTSLGEQCEESKPEGYPSPVLRAHTLLSDAPRPRPLNEIEAATAEFSAIDPCAVHSWSVSNLCPTEGEDEHGISSLGFLIKEEEDESLNRGLFSVPVIEEDISYQPTESFRNHAKEKGTGPQSLVKSWLTNFLEPPFMLVTYESLVDESLVKCAIDPETGEFLAPVLQPETVRSVVQGPCEGYADLGWRQANMTAKLHIERHIKNCDNIANALRLNLEQLDQEPISLAGAKEEERWPEAKCVIRPAAPSDFANIAEIINAEASSEANPQIFQDKPATVEGVSKIFDACIANNRPFIVATPAQDDFLDKSKWPQNSDDIYQEFSKYMATQPRPVVPVVGFAFVSDYRMGLYGAPCPASQYSGQVRLLIHPDQQRKLYGSALMSRLFLSVSPFHRSVVDHVWKCEKPDGVYEFPVRHNKRQYTQLYAELFFEPHDLQAYQWKADFLEKFGFQEIGYFRNAAAQIEDEHRGQWLNMVLLQSDIMPPSKIMVPLLS
ncbi:Acyl-CoA N-acyltransferase [Metarhizium rileyi]|uniref:Acyl-CoA N-acyltransferase n=1 Tax=Metarhizium rileyi (strain RCEF 4871) TaxID=1649241 RepID=A0A162J3B1_METRR|nr:Acyl-CoA N-acyltransferase [Metarhizium rileyi RCEF 4871]